MATWLDADGSIRCSAPGNLINLGRLPSDGVRIESPNGITISGTVSFPATVLLGANGQALSVPAGPSSATNTTITVAGTTAGAILYDTAANGSLGTTLYTYNDLVRALKVAGVIAK